MVEKLKAEFAYQRQFRGQSVVIGDSAGYTLDLTGSF